MWRAGIVYAQPLRLWVSTVPTLPPWPQLGPALSFNWVSRLPLPPNIPPGALGNIPWFAADCPAPRSLRCGQSGRRPGGRRLGRQRPGTLHSGLAQEVVGGAEQPWKADSTHLIARERHLPAVLHGSLRLQCSLPWPLPLSKSPLCCPRMRVLQPHGSPPNSLPVPGSILPRGLCSRVPHPGPLSHCPLPPLCLPTNPSGRSTSPGHIIGAQSRRPPRKSFWNLTTIPPAWFL